jgi:hypothetical protein
MQPGRETELKTEEIKFKTLHTDRDIGAHILMQELIACLCGCHSSELQSHYSYIFSRCDEKGEVIKLPNDIVDLVRTHLTELEDLVRDVEIERYNEMFNNDELRAQLAEKDKQHLEQEKRIKEMEKKHKSQEKRIQARNKELES